MKRSSILILAAMVLVISSCRTRKGPHAIDLSAEHMSAYWANQYEFEYLELRGKATTQIGEKTHNVSLHLKMKKDSVVWGKLSLLGFELARILITNDSFFMVSPMSSQYMAYDNRYLVGYIGFKPTVSQLQAMLLGNAPFDSTHYNINGNDQLEARHGLATSLIQISEEFRTHRSHLNTPDTLQHAKFGYDSYDLVNEGRLPRDVSIDIAHPKNPIKVDLNYQVIGVQPIADFPFTIPSTYIRM